MQRAAAINDLKDENSEINLTPMLDVVFIMLIFFVVTASFIKETGISVNQSDSQPKSGDHELILIAIGEADDIWIDRRIIDPRAVRANIERMHAEKPNAIVVIQAHRVSSTNALVQVMNASRKAGIYDIALAKD